ncbi:MAG: hypothetical protein GXO86_00420 [Chlorobi bacterium]|nr:hypothetical protein [Chlorobiota bacterium]
MKYLILSLGLILLLASCHKNGEPKFINEKADEIKYVINLSADKITSYSKYVDNKLTETSTFFDHDTVAGWITKNPQNKITFKSTFMMGNNSLADSSIDTGFIQNGLYVALTHYKYKNDFMVYSTTYWEQSGDNPEAGESQFSKTIENENVVSMQDIHGCIDYFNYNNDINKIDIQDFSNGITGKKNKNLVKHVSWENGCPCGPSCSFAYSDYQYKLDNNGYVTKMTETYTPCYSEPASDKITRTIRTTIYEYNTK